MSTQETVSSRIVGLVKWFNNKAGYGFITASEGEFAGKDVFVHYSTINVTDSQYKFLIQGEYVEFVLVKSDNEAHEFQATDVSGIKGGPLMCETRYKNRSQFESRGEGATPRQYRVGRESRSGEDGFERVRRTRPSRDAGVSATPR